VFAARRVAGGRRVEPSYAQLIAASRSIAAALGRRALSAERPALMLSGKDLEHLTLQFGCLWAGVPFAPVSPAYTLLAQDFARLRQLVSMVTPGLIFASGGALARAMAAVGGDAELVLTEGAVAGRSVTPSAELLGEADSAAAGAAHAAIGAETIAKFLFTSGSTRAPEAVTHTHPMLCANHQMQSRSFALMGDEPPVLVDWLPWNHTFGGNQNACTRPARRACCGHDAPAEGRQLPLATRQTGVSARPHSRRGQH
jgi:feruloyl-CoA synthase